MKPSIKYIVAGYAALIVAYTLAGDASARTRLEMTAAPFAASLGLELPRLVNVT